MSAIPAATRIPLASISPSATNPRKHFDEAKHAELTDSVKRYDVLQPILLRPNGGPDTYELVAGERRYRAAVAAGLADIPATVRELSDADVLEIQVIENLQRADLHELEEAEGYEKLLRCKHPAGDPYTVDEIATKVGKSRTYVFGRLKLLALCPEARKAFHAGEIDGSKALLIARIGHHDTQRQALKDITKGEYGRGPMSYRDAHQHVLQTYMLKLSGAPFDTKDETLLAKAGACGPCPKRTGNQADLFGDVKSADVCTDPKCFDDKRRAHYAVAAKQLEADGFKVITGEAAKKALPGWDHRREGSDYIQMSGYERLEASTYATGRTTKVSALMGKEFTPVKLQHPLTGEIFDVASSQAIAAAATKAKRSGGGKASTNRSSSGPRQHVKKPEEILRERVVVELYKKLPAQFGRHELSLLVEEVSMSMDAELDALADEIVPRKDGKKHDFSSADKAIKAALPKMAPDTMARLVMACVISSRCYDVKRLVETAKRFKVDAEKIKKTIAEEAKAAQVKVKAPAKAKAKAPKKSAARVATFVHPVAKSALPVITPLIKPVTKPLTDEEVRTISPRAKPAKKKAAAKRPVPSFMKPMQPSAELAAIVGSNAMAKTEVTSKLWGYIKKHDLQDKSNRRMINTDDKLKALFGGKKQLSMFDMTKVVAKNLK